MSTENHDQLPAVPEGSEPVTSPAPEQAAPPAAQPAAAAEPVAAPSDPIAPPAPPAGARPVQQVSAPAQEPHPQAQPTQELHPQQHHTAPYPPLPPQPGQRPAPQYGQYAPGNLYPQPQPQPQQHQQPHHPQAQYPQPQAQPPYGQHAGQRPAAPYPQQYAGGYRPAHQQPGASFSNPYERTAPGQQGQPGEPGQPTEPREPGGSAEPGDRKPRGWGRPVVIASVLSALLASGGTAALVTALDDDARPASMQTIGDPGRVDSAPVAESTVTNPDWQAVTAAVAQSVVSIQVTTAQGGGEGSGLVLDDQGHILTNNHVVAGAQDDVVTVTLADGRLFRADIVGLDATTDLAVVKIQDPPSGLQPVALGDSDKVRVGDPVLAVGNPLGLANTATTGIVSALDRPVSASDGSQQSRVVTNAIQIDAAINPGNSGGPLFDAQGRVIGITSSIATLSGGMLGSQSGSIGLGFAIPVNLAKNISEQLIDGGAAEHAFLGVELRDATATADGISRRGAGVNSVTAGSPAAAAGIQAGDVVVAIDDQPVTSAESLTAFVRERRANERVTLTVVREGSASKIEATLAVREETASPAPQNEQPAPQEPGSDDGSGQGQDGGSLWDRLFPNDR